MAIDWQMHSSGEKKCRAEADRCREQAADNRNKAFGYPPGPDRTAYLDQARVWEDFEMRNLEKAAMHQQQIALAREEMRAQIRQREAGGDRAVDDLGHTR